LENIWVWGLGGRTGFKGNMDLKSPAVVTGRGGMEGVTPVGRGFLTKTSGLGAMLGFSALSCGRALVLDKVMGGDPDVFVVVVLVAVMIGADLGAGGEVEVVVAVGAGIEVLAVVGLRTGGDTADDAAAGIDVVAAVVIGAGLGAGGEVEAITDLAGGDVAVGIEMFNVCNGAPDDAGGGGESVEVIPGVLPAEESTKGTSGTSS